MNSQAPQGEFRCPACGSKSYAISYLPAFNTSTGIKEELACCHGYAIGCGWRGTWSDMLAARQGGLSGVTIVRSDPPPEADLAYPKEFAKRMAEISQAKPVMSVEIESLKQQLAEARDDKEYLDRELAKWKDGYAEAHRRMDEAGIPSAVGAECNDPKCDCHLVHRVHVTLEQLAAVTARADRLAAENGIFLDAILNICSIRVKLYVSDRTLDAAIEAAAKAVDNSPATSAEAERVRRLEEALEAVLYFYGRDPEAFGDKATLNSMAAKFGAVAEKCRAALDAEKGGA